METVVRCQYSLVCVGADFMVKQCDSFQFGVNILGGTVFVIIHVSVAVCCTGVFKTMK